MADRRETMLTVALAAAALGVAARATSEVFLAPPVAASSERRAPERVSGWEDGLAVATRVAGSEAAPVTILALVDLQCPVCRYFHETALDVVAERPDDVRLLYAHFPLDYHPFALPAARAAECALDEGPGAFARWVDAVFAAQDSLGAWPWSRYAKDAGLADPERFEGCAEDASREERIRAGRAFGEEVGVRGTPTVVVDGWKYPEPPRPEELGRIVDSILVEGSVR